MTDSLLVRRQEDDGFTLVELLVVMVIIGILAGIAVTTILAVQGRGRDTSTKADLGNVAKEVTSYYVDGSGPLYLSLQDRHYVLSEASGDLADCTAARGAWCAEGLLSRGTTTPGTGNATSRLGVPGQWCVSLGNPGGRIKDYRFDAQEGLTEGHC